MLKMHPLYCRKVLIILLIFHFSKRSMLTDNPVYPLKNKLLYPLPPWVCPLKFLKNLSLYYSAIAYLSGVLLQMLSCVLGGKHGVNTGNFFGKQRKVHRNTRITQEKNAIRT